MKTISFDLACDKFLQNGKILKNFQPATIAGYRSCFALFAKQTGIVELQSFSPELIEKFLYAGRVERNWSVCTYRTYHKQLRAFCNWCVKKKLIPYDYTKDIDRPPLERKLPEFLSPEQSETLLETAYHLNYHYKIEGIRNRAILGVMLFAGLRLSEVANLKRQHIDLDNQVLTVRQGKWNKDRQIPISSRLMYFLLEYVEAQGKSGRKHIHFFSAIGRDEPLGAHGIQVMCQKIRQRSGVKFSPHVLRHTFATLTYMGSRDIYAVSGLLGHAKVETTQIYAHLSLDDKRHSVESHVMNRHASV
jgi:integrase/recombinase XerD